MQPAPNASTARNRPLRIGFLDQSGWDFHALTPDSAPLGGSHSALCYLSRALAECGHHVFLLAHGRSSGTYGGVQSIFLPGLDSASIRSLTLDVCICVLAAGAGQWLRHSLDPRTRIVLWTQHAADQVDLRALQHSGERDAYERFAFVSQWQTEQLQQAFNIPPARCALMPNAVAPPFENMFPPQSPILAEKTNPPILAYTSTPFRGLAELLDAFPAIRAAVPGVRLHVYSNMSVYHVPRERDLADYGSLYERCRRMDGVEYIGALPQEELARQLREVAVLAYANVFPETFCIAALEAMAAGCRIVTTRLGALPETTAGFAHLIDRGRSRDDFVRRFADAVIQSLRQVQEDPQAAEKLARLQVEHVNQHHRWAHLALRWSDWLISLRPPP